MIYSFIVLNKKIKITPTDLLMLIRSVAMLYYKNAFSVRLSTILHRVNLQSKQSRLSVSTPKSLQLSHTYSIGSQS